MSKFQIIFISIFVICIIAGVTLFATYKSQDAKNTLPTVEIWGTFPSQVFGDYLQKINQTAATALAVNYVQIAKKDFEKNFIDALARGHGPDAVLIPQEDMAHYADKLIIIPDTVLTERDFKNTYIPQAELYWTTQGSLAVPFIIDPLVMYWNRDMFTNSGLATYPKYWDEFSDIIKRITVKDENANIRKSAIALGEFNNISHAREILSTLLFQAGNPITTFTTEGLQSTLGDGKFNGATLSGPAISFFTQFSDPRSTSYSWNRSLSNSKSSFLSGNLATYFGFASELADLRAKNPNINFDVAPMPQIRPKKTNPTNLPKATYGSMYGFSIARSSANQSATFQALSILTAPANSAYLSQLTYLPSVRRDVVAQGSTDPYMSIFLNSALISKSWLDRDTARSTQIFTTMVESVTSGKKDLHNAIQDASGELDISLGN